MVWLACNVGHLIVNVLVWHVTARPAPRAKELLRPWYQWDTTHYVRIAEGGYSYPESPAFFPVYPLLIRTTDAVLPQDSLVAGLVIANVASFGALLLIHRLAAHEFDESVASRSTFYLAVFPVGFFLFAAYNESLFLLFTVGALYCARRGHWWLAGALGGLSSATRLFGVLLLAPLCWEYLRQHGWRPRRFRPDVLAIALVPTGLLAYAIYCWRVLGDPLAWSHAQDYWKRSYTWPGMPLWSAATHLNDYPLLHSGTFQPALELGSLLGALGLLALCVVGPWRLRSDQRYLFVYAAAALLVLSSTQVGFGHPLQSAPRLVMEVVPVFFVLARMGANAIVDRVYVVAGVTLQTILLLTFLNAGFVA